MKRFTFALSLGALVLLLAFSGFSTPDHLAEKVAVADASGNLVPNPSFEEGTTSPTGWEPLCGVWDTSVAHTGSHSARLQHCDEPSTWRSVPLSLSPGNYCFGFWHRETSTVDYAEVHFGDDGPGIGWYIYAPANADGQWHYHEECGGHFYGPTMRFWLIGSSNGSGTVWFDDIYLGTTPSNSISGRVRDSSGNPISGVIISDGAGHTATTDSDGNYTLSGLTASSYTIEPSKSYCTFSPASRTVTVPPDATGQDFTGTCAGGTSYEGRLFAEAGGDGPFCIWTYTLRDCHGIFVAGVAELDTLPLTPYVERYVRITGGIIDVECIHETVVASQVEVISDPCPITCSPDQWRGEYFNNMSLSGTPALVRCDNAIDFDWGTGSPASGINPDNFSVRWTGNPSFAQAGRYRFHTNTDDGVRLWVDGWLLIDQWHNQGATEYTAEINLSAGQHQVRMEYYENVGWAGAQLWWEGVCQDAAEFVSQSTFPTMQPGQAFQIYFEVRNTGSCTWRQSDNYYLANINSTPLGANPRQELGADVAPGTTKRWDISMTAPTTPGTYRTQWMLKHGDNTFGPNMYIDVTVAQPQPDARVSRSLTLSKTTANVNEPVDATFTIHNYGGAQWTAARVCAAQTGGGGFPCDENVTIAAGASRDFSQRQSFSQPGTYTFEVVWQDSSSNWHQVPADAGVSRTATLNVVSPCKTSPNNGLSTCYMQPGDIIIMNASGLLYWAEKTQYRKTRF